MSLRMMLGLILAVGMGCKPSDDDTLSAKTVETIETAVDEFAAFDEMSSSDGNFSLLHRQKGDFEKLYPSPGIQDLLGIPDAHAATCSTTFSYACSGSVMTQNWSDCTLGLARLNGSVTYTFSSGCTVGITGDTVTRVPSYSILGRRLGSIAVTAAGVIGQRVTKTGSGFNFSNDGIRRKWTDNQAVVQSDVTTSTTSDLVFTGTNRATRELVAGTLRVRDNLTGNVCDISPTSVNWSATCTCPVDGRISGSCTDGKQFSVQFQGCGVVTIQVGDESGPLAIERCRSI